MERAGRLQKKLVVDGWWLLVNEGKRFRDGEMRALRAHGMGRVGFTTARGIRWRHRENVALADNLRLMVRKLQAQRNAFAALTDLRGRVFLSTQE
jgi:hypothetical protein